MNQRSAAQGLFCIKVVQTVLRLWFNAVPVRCIFGQYHEEFFLKPKLLIVDDSNVSRMMIRGRERVVRLDVCRQVAVPI
jgi:hypothetical protein